MNIIKRRIVAVRGSGRHRLIYIFTFFKTEFTIETFIHCKARTARNSRLELDENIFLKCLILISRQIRSEPIRCRKLSHVVLVAQNGAFGSMRVKYNYVILANNVEACVYISCIVTCLMATRRREEQGFNVLNSINTK